MKKKKIGLCLAFTGENYGMLLQAYATQTVIESLGYETDIINYIAQKKRRIKFSWGLIFFIADVMLKKITGKFMRKKYADALTADHMENLKLRKKAADKFREKRLHNFRICNGIDALTEAGKSYDAVLIGSDQQWIPSTAFTNFRTLRFVPDNVLKISYATSLGVSKYPFYCKSSAADYWKRINYLSVREEEGKNLIQSICDIPVKVVSDPTYLLTLDKWDELIPREKVCGEGYLLCYFIGDAKDNKIKAREFANANNLECISILSDETCTDIDISFANKIIKGASPEYFVNLIRHAAYVFTDSFHGIAFSVINRRQVFVFYRNMIKNKYSRNSRIYNIIKKFNLENRLITDFDLDLCKIPEIDYDKLYNILNEFRNESIKFLENAFGDANFE